ncbi:hypothetical protein MC7420_5509 [Coleofasciculus chthonoplastes PCC 7420]|uniref:Uncharacterized protein n=1 Tax=Coleofasciculus chthonoplastes PCC 7420 TaxID=118168 RepID=B4VQ84_9CYAN|nr:hypothetical protein [Coleofasciculus chthonoplastes]EDX76075.1 hypothetical protein MC7420_5509 [Coleofasciculus chthonoplastes PCC 7420]
MPNALSTKKKILQDKYNALEADYISVNQQIIQTRDKADRNQLQRQADDLFEQMERVESQLNQCQSSNTTYNDYYKNWEKHLPKINYSQASQLFNRIFDHFGEKGGAVFFLLQNCHPMGGKWCMEKIKASLKDKGVWSPRAVGFAAWEQPNPTDFIQRLGTSFNLEDNTSSVEVATQRLIDKIYNSLQIDSTVFLEIRLFSLDSQSDFLTWLIPQFWIPLISRLRLIRQDLPLVKFVTVMVVETEIPQTCRTPALFCQGGKLSPKKIIELKLGNWTEKEIRTWLYRYSGLATPNVGRTPREIEQMSRVVYQMSQGRPIDVYSILMNELTRVFG